MEILLLPKVNAVPELKLVEALVHVLVPATR